MLTTEVVSKMFGTFPRFSDKNVFSLKRYYECFETANGTDTSARYYREFINKFFFSILMHSRCVIVNVPNNFRNSRDPSLEYGVSDTPTRAISISIENPLRREDSRGDTRNYSRLLFTMLYLFIAWRQP